MYQNKVNLSLTFSQRLVYYKLTTVKWYIMKVRAVRDPLVYVVNIFHIFSPREYEAIDTQST